MSDSFLIIIPADPYFIPEPESDENAVNLLKNLTPAGGAVQSFTAVNIEFIDCGENAGTVKCPACSQPVDIGWWHNTMGRDYSENGFMMNRYPLPCCGRQYSLNDLVYEMPQGFSKYQIEVAGTDIPELTEDRIEKLEKTLKTKIRMINRRI